MNISIRLFVILLSQNLEPLFWQYVVRNVLNPRKPLKQQRNGKKKNECKEYTVEELEIEPTKGKEKFQYTQYTEEEVEQKYKKINNRSSWKIFLTIKTLTLTAVT